MGLKYKRNTDGWTPSTDDDLNNDDPWTADFRVKKERKKKKEGQTESKFIPTYLDIEAYTNSGDFYIKEPGSETSILRYNARTDEIVINDEEKFEEYFAGSKEKEKRLNLVKKITMKDILAIAESEVNKAERRRRLDLSPRRDAKRLRRVFEKLEAKPGYKSLFNTAEPAEISEATSQDKGNKDKGPNTPKDGKVSANIDLELFSSSDLNPFNGSSQNPGSGSRVGSNSDLVGSSVASLAMPVEAPPVAAVDMGLMRYPVIPPPFGYDHIKISAHDYIHGGLKREEGSFQLIGAQASENLNGKIVSKTNGTVILPMQPNLSETNSIDWGGDKMNPIKAAFADVAGQTIERIGDTDFGGAAQSLIVGTIDNFKNLLKTEKDAVIAYFAGQAVGANVIGRATGKVINPNLELLFSGPRLRTFEFNFTLTPRSENEAIMARRIIKFFKFCSAPALSTNGLFLKTPKIFQLEYIFDKDDGGQHPFLNKFKPCALTTFNVNYTPDGSYSTYKGGSMTSYAIAMSFGELRPIYAGDNKMDEGAEPTDMGF